MSGRIRKYIDEIIVQRSHGNETIATTTKAKLIIKGLNPDLYTHDSPDDPVVMEKVTRIAGELGVTLSL